MNNNNNQGKSTLKKYLCTCDQCGNKFFLHPEDSCKKNVIVVCDADEDAFFCSPFCRIKWLDAQHEWLERSVFE